MSIFLRKYLKFLYLPLSLLYMEIVLKLWCFGEISWRGLIFTLLLSGAMGFAATLSCCLGRHFSRIMMTLWLIAAFLLFGAQSVYYNIFKTFLAFYSVTQAGGVIGNFLDQALIGIWHALPALIAHILPLVIWLVFGKKLAAASSETTDSQRAVLAGLFAVLQLTGTCSIMGSTSGVMSAAYLYSDSLVPNLSVSYFGAVTTMRLDLRELMLSEPEPNLASYPIFPAFSDVPETAPETSPHQKPQGLLPGDNDADAAYNVLEIDFDALLAEETDPDLISMHQYFRDREPTKKNAYTGMFEGKNLIWIIAESFSSLALDEAHTPTLCKLAGEGFVFENFYNPLWGVSTSDGEYVTLTGLIPKYGVWSFSESSGNYMPFSMGNMLRDEGYLTIGYHNHSYNYYNRDKSHPNMGYDWRARGSGLYVTDQWPESDLEMIQNSVADYINQEPFHIYYLTVSGHMYYNFDGNAMAYKHQNAVADLPYNEGPRAYIACNMELDAAITALLDNLDKAGILEDTVIVLSGDHYPYALSETELEELNGGPFADDLELYHSSFILWSADMTESVHVEKPCSSLDILPTLANLFGMPYDSRLVMGRDILSDADPLVVFADHSFITDRGRYFAATDDFVPRNGESWEDMAPDAYAGEILSQLEDMFAYSADILIYDYYSIAFKDTEG